MKRDFELFECLLRVFLYRATTQRSRTDDILPGIDLFPERCVLFDLTSLALFLRAVEDALSSSRYLPAEAGGRRVRQLVEQTFAFRIASR